MKALGRPVRHFAGGKNSVWTLAIMALACLGLPVVNRVFQQNELDTPHEVFLIVGGFALAGMAIWTAKSSATICENGFRYAGFRSRGEMLWEEVEAIRHEATKMRVLGGLSAGHTTHHVIIKDGKGQKASLGKNIDHGKECIDLICSKVDPRLREKMFTAYQSGKPLDLGAVKVSFDHVQMRLRTGVQTAKIPRANVAGCSMSEGYLWIGERKNGKVKQHRTYVARVDNAFQLVELINQQVVQQTMAASTR
jgi:hypothetical protein